MMIPQARFATSRNADAAEIERKKPRQIVSVVM
jgi:hypothetical protein